MKAPGIYKALRETNSTPTSLLNLARIYVWKLKSNILRLYGRTPWRRVRTRRLLDELANMGRELEG